MRAEEKALGLSKSDLHTPQESDAEDEADREEEAEAENAEIDDGSTDEDSRSEADDILAAAVHESLNMHSANGKAKENETKESPVELAEEILPKQEYASVSDEEEGKAESVPEAKKEPEMSKKDKRRLKEAKKKAEAEAADKNGTVSGKVRSSRKQR